MGDEDPEVTKWHGDPLVQAAFQDPRYRHLQSFGNLADDEPEMFSYDRALTMQALAAVYQIRSTEQQSAAMMKATWALVFATCALVLATLALLFTG